LAAAAAATTTTTTIAAKCQHFVTDLYLATSTADLSCLKQRQ